MKRRRPPFKRFSRVEVERILRTVCVDEDSPYKRTINWWAKRLGVPFGRIRLICYGRTYRKIAPEVTRLEWRGSRNPGASRHQAKRSAERAALRKGWEDQARIAADLRLRLGALTPETLEAWVSAQVKLCEASWRAGIRAERKKRKKKAKTGDAS